jgi:hypothetical protein
MPRVCTSAAVPLASWTFGFTALIFSNSALGGIDNSQ